MKWVQLYGNFNILWHCLSLGLKWKLKWKHFQSCSQCWVFQMCWHIECSTFTASSFRIWDSSTGIPLPPLALFVIMFPKAHLPSHSRISDSRWVITPLWLSRSLKTFLHRSVYFCHLFLISSASVRSLSFLSFIVPIFAWNVPLTFLVFMKRSLVFPVLLFFYTSLNCSLKKAFLSLLAMLWNSAFSWCLVLSPRPQVEGLAWRPQKQSWISRTSLELTESFCSY